MRMKFFVLFLTVFVVTAKSNIKVYTKGSPLIEESSPSALHQLRSKRGITAERNQFPYHVQLVYVYNIPLISRCSGAIISEKHVATVANCVCSKPTAIIAGILERDEVSPDRQTVKVAEVKVHPRHNRLSGVANIALIVLDFALTFNSVVNKVGIPPPFQRAQGIAVQTGWQLKLLFPNYKLQVTQKKISSCTARMITTSLLTLLRSWIQSEHVICAKGGSVFSECRTDSGEPLVQDNVLIGLFISDFENCKLIGSTSVYANIAKYSNWLTYEMGDGNETTTPSDADPEGTEPSDSEDSPEE